MANDSQDGTTPDAAPAPVNPRKSINPDEGREVRNGVTIHPQATRLFSKCPWMRKIPVFGEAAEGFGPTVVCALGVCYLFCKGIADQMISYARQPMFVNRYGIDAERYQRLANISTMGWSIKAFTAMLCDGFAFLGYTKRWYMLISCVVGAVFALVYALLPAKPSSANTAAAFVFLCSYGKANVDILSEGHYSRLMRRNPKPGPALVSWIWWFIMIGAIIAAAIQGPLSDANKMQWGVIISAIFQFITSIIFVFNWYEERKNRVERAADARFMYEELRKEREKLGLEPMEAERAPQLDREGSSSSDPAAKKKQGKAEPYEGEDQPNADAGELTLDDELLDDAEEDEDYDEYADLPYDVPRPEPCFFGAFEMNREVITRNWKIFVYSGVMTAAVVAMTCANILADTLGLLIVCVVVSTVCCAFSFWALPVTIAKANVFGYLQMVVYLQLPGALDNFYLATPECLPDGPHFSYTFYNTIAAVIGNVAGLAGVTAFNYIFSKRSYRLTFIITTLVQIIASVFDIIIVERWNLYIGIPDHAMYILGDAVVYQVCYMLSWMPMVVLLSRLCPRGSESVVYALMAGFSNLGQTTSSAVGAIIMEYGWPVEATQYGPCDFTNVPWLLLVGHILLPLLVGPLTLLLPAARICDNIDIDGKVVREEVEEEALEQSTAPSSLVDTVSVYPDGHSHAEGASHRSEL